jgi:hypothetical protein
LLLKEADVKVDWGEVDGESYGGRGKERIEMIATYARSDETRCQAGCMVRGKSHHNI